LARRGGDDQRLPDEGGDADESARRSKPMMMAGGAPDAARHLPDDELTDPRSIPTPCCSACSTKKRARLSGPATGCALPVLARRIEGVLSTLPADDLAHLIVDGRSR